MRRFTVYAILVICTALNTFGQDKKNLKFEFSGYVRADAFVDSRSTFNLREGAILIAPLDKNPDASKNDLYDKSTLSMFAIHTRLAGKAGGAEFLGGKAGAYVEAEFFGVSDADINGVRMRHAYVTADFNNTSLLFGQFWHPLFITSMVPSFSFAAPFIPYSRNPQFRITQKFDDFSVMFAACSQRDFLSNGPDDKGAVVRNTTFIKNAAMPMLDLVFTYKKDGTVAGVGGEVKKIVPRIKDLKGNATTVGVTGFALSAFGKVNLAPLNVMAQVTYGSNLADMIMMGGYAVKASDTLSYTAAKVVSAWGEISVGKELAVNLFLGYSKNLGLDDNPSITGSNRYYYLINQNIESIMRIAPNVQYTEGAVKLVAEVDYTTALYGTPNILDKAKVENTTRYSDVRLTFTSFYYF